MSSINELVDIGKSIGLDGAELHEFIREVQAKEREDRMHEREQQREEAARQHELNMVKERREEAQIQNELEKEREERAIRDHERKLELMEAKSKMEIKPEKELQSLHMPIMKGPKLPPFDESTDNIDSYLQRFERYAVAQAWDKKLHWAANLSVLLKGNALDVFSRLPVDQSLDYDVLKSSLLKRFEMTEEGFRKRFRSGRPEQGETFSQFAVRLESYFVRWHELANVGKNYHDLRDLMVRDQFLQAAGTELRLFLKERSPSSVKDMSKLADQFAEARGNALNFVKPKSNRNNTQSNSQIRNSGSAAHSQTRVPSSSNTPSQASKTFERDTKREFGSSSVHIPRCYKCKSTEHLANKCPKKGTSNHASTVSKSTKGETETESKSTENESKTQNSESLSVSCNFPGTVGNGMPVTQGRVGQQMISVLRDTGCSGVVIRRGLVLPEQLTGEMQSCILANGSEIKVPVAKVSIDTPYFVGSVIAWCMDNPVYDLILGNIQGARKAEDPDKSWNGKERLSHAVETRAQRKKADRSYRPLKVPNAFQDFATPDEMKVIQNENGNLLPVAFASRKLKGGEPSYSVIEKECLAVVWAIQKFQKYLYGKAFVLETDHQPLLYLNKMSGTNCRLMRWALQLQPYKFRIQAIKGRDNVGADFLSRM